MSDAPVDAIFYGFKVKADPDVPEGEIQMRDTDTGEVLAVMPDTTDDAVTLEAPLLTEEELENAKEVFYDDLRRTVYLTEKLGDITAFDEFQRNDMGYLGIRLYNDVRTLQRQIATMTSEHTLTGCARCGTGDRPGHMVPVGDERLCVGCAGVEIERLQRRLATCERGHLVHELGSEEAADRYLAFINQPNPEPPRPRRKEQP